MDSFLSDQSSMTGHAVVNYSSSSYGGFLFRSPNSPPPSPSPSVASLSQLFLDAKLGCYGSRSPTYHSSPAGCIQLRQPPLLPFPKSATIPSTSSRIPAAFPASSIRSRRQNPKRKGKMFVGSMKDTSAKDEGKPAIASVEIKQIEKDDSQPFPMTEASVKDEGKPAIASLEINQIEKDESQPFPMTEKPVEKGERRSSETGDGIESVYSLSPPPSSLPLPRFSLTKPKADAGRSVAGFCIAEAEEIAGDTDDLQHILRIF